MADEATTQDSTQESSAETPAVDSQSQEQTTATDSQQTTTDEGQSESNDQADKGKEIASTGDQKPSETQDVKPESKPLSRRSAQYRIEQLVNENKELKKQLNPPKQQDDWDDEGASDDPKPQPDINKIVSEAVEAALKPVITEHSKAADDAEINELFSGDNAADKPKYEGKIRELWNLPQYKDVAASDLYKIAKFDELQSSIPAIEQQAIEKHKQAEKEAKESSASGTSNTSNRTGSGKSASDLSDQQVLERNERIKAGLPV